MAKVEVIKHIQRDIEEVFSLISDHEVFLSLLPGMRTKVVIDGKLERNGLGCIREVFVGKRIRYLEEITAWVRPLSFEYIIREASMPIRHYGSRLELTRSGLGTDIKWTSNYDVPIPMVGWAVGAYMKRQYRAAFAELLNEASRRLSDRTDLHGVQ